MKMVNISQAKARLSALIEAAENGESVLIMKGARPAVSLVKITEDDLSLHVEIPIQALAGFNAEIEADRKSGKLIPLGRTSGEAASHLRRSQ